MPVTFVNSNGTISINNEVIARICGLAVLDCYGVVGMAAKSMKDGFVHLLKKESLTKGIQVYIEENNEISLDFHIIVDYGTNISAIAETMINTAKYKLKEFLNLQANEIKVFVEGVRVDG